MASIAALPSSPATFVTSMKHLLPDLAAFLRARHPLRGIATTRAIVSSKREMVGIWMGKTGLRLKYINYRMLHVAVHSSMIESTSSNFQS